VTQWPIEHEFVALHPSGRFPFDIVGQLPIVLRNNIRTCDRVTRLGEFSAQWVIVFFGQWFENDINSANFRATFFVVPVMVLFFLQKMARASFWATFSQTHLVTLHM
jgi:hypothetical protein